MSAERSSNLEQQSIHHRDLEQVLPVWVVIVNFYTSAYLTSCIAALLQDGVRGIVIVDNSTDDEEWNLLSASFASQAGVAILRMPSNNGFACGVNAGVASLNASPDDYIWILNPDTVAPVGAAAALMRAAQSHPIEILSPLVVTGPDDDLRVWFAGGDLDLSKGTTSHRGYGQLLAEYQADEKASSFITGAAMFMQLRAWLMIGGLSESFFMYWEDADLSIRAEALGIGMRLVPHVTIWHRVGGAGSLVEGMSAQYYFFMQRNRAVVMHGASGSYRSLFTTGLPITVKNIAIPLLREKHGRLTKMWASIGGLYRGVTYNVRAKKRAGAV